MALNLTKAVLDCMKARHEEKRIEYFCEYFWTGIKNIRKGLLGIVQGKVSTSP